MLFDLLLIALGVILLVISGVAAYLLVYDDVDGRKSIDTAAVDNTSQSITKTKRSPSLTASSERSLRSRPSKEELLIQKEQSTTSLLKRRHTEQELLEQEKERIKAASPSSLKKPSSVKTFFKKLINFKANNQ